MRVLLDACVWGGAKELLSSAGHDVVCAADWGEDPGDEELLARSHSEHRALITLDKDFGELAVVQGQAHSGIIRLVGIPARRQGEIAVWALRQYEADIVAGALLTIDSRRTRIRR